MKLSTLLKEQPDHLMEPGDCQDTVIGVMARLVRNLKGHRFPGWSTAESRAAVAEQLLPGLLSLPDFSKGFHAEMPELGFDDRRIMMVNSMLSPAQAARQDGCHVLVSHKRNVVAFVNEEEHLVLHMFRQGYKCPPKGDTMRTGHMLNDLQKMRDKLDGMFDFAHNTQDGYLTSMPGESGDGIQLFVMLHLPALTFSNMMGQVTKAMEKLHVSISPFYSDGQDDTGSRYMLYSLPGPEGSLGEVKGYFFEVAQRVVERELSVRLRLLEEPGMRLFDHIGRAYGLLKYARRLSIKEMRDAFSSLRLATVLGIIKWDVGPYPIIRGINRVSRLIVQEAITHHGDEQTPLFVATACRAFLESQPHEFLTHADIPPYPENY